MMMNDNKKKMATLIVAKLKGSADKMKEAPQNDGAEAEIDDKSVAADEVFDAIERKDRQAFVSAIQSLVDMCMNSESEDEEYEEPSEEA